VFGFLGICPLCSASCTAYGNRGVAGNVTWERAYFSPYAYIVNKGGGVNDIPITTDSIKN
jgi:hypothetical protein